MSAASCIEDGETPARRAGDDRGVRIVAFYLPQFHRIPENDRWWGNGFTEWSLVRRAKRLYSEHDQPRVPAAYLGYYDVMAPQTFARQVALAQAYGIAGFAFYHYWFSGRLLLERPIERWLRAGPSFPFCLVWANEPWTRAWDGRTDIVLQEQSYGGPEVWRDHFRYLMPAFTDARAIRIAERPLFLLYRAGHIPRLREMLDVWREEADRHGLPPVFVVAMLSGFIEDDHDDVFAALDGVCEFAPFAARSFRTRGPCRRYGFVDDYHAAWDSVFRVPNVHPLQIRGAFVRFDNTPRRGRDGVVYGGASPQAYEQYLRVQLRRSHTLPSDRRFLFVNAWNEWSEGCYLEPDERTGLAYLVATRNALLAETPMRD